MAELFSKAEISQDLQALCERLNKSVQEKQEEYKITEEHAAFTPNWKFPIIYDDDEDYSIQFKEYLDNSSKAITPDLSTVEPDNSLNMEDEHLSTISETKLDEVIKSSVENLVPIPSESEGISDDTCDVPVCEDPSTFDALNDNSEILSDSNNDGTSSDDDDFEDIEYVSLEEVNDVDQEEKEIDLEDILQIQDVILREKLLNINRLIINIESLKDNPTPIPIKDSDSFFEKSDTSLSYSNNSLPKFETFSDHTEETRSGSTTTHANNSLPDNVSLPKFESFHFDLYNDPSSPRPPPEPPDVEICLNFEPDTTMINNFDKLNKDECFNPGGDEIVLFPNVEDDDSFTFVIRTFLPFLTYSEDSPLLLSTGSEDTIFDPGIST
ncbi:hypothetical protein Tco_0497509 [Tanacetum coccineum]